jgi:hypothetical protein
VCTDDVVSAGLYTLRKRGSIKSSAGGSSKGAGRMKSLGKGKSVESKGIALGRLGATVREDEDAVIGEGEDAVIEVSSAGRTESRK